MPALVVSFQTSTKKITVEDIWDLKERLEAAFPSLDGNVKYTIQYHDEEVGCDIDIEEETVLKQGMKLTVKVHKPSGGKFIQ